MSFFCVRKQPGEVPATLRRIQGQIRLKVTVLDDALPEQCVDPTGIPLKKPSKVLKFDGDEKDPGGVRLCVFFVCFLLSCLFFEFVRE